MCICMYVHMYVTYTHLYIHVSTYICMVVCVDTACTVLSRLCSLLYTYTTQHYSIMFVHKQILFIIFIGYITRKAKEK